MNALHQGQSVTGQWPRSRGLHYGDGVFRSLRVHAGAPLDWDRHLHKLQADARQLNLEPPPGDLLRDEAQRLIEAMAPQGVLKILLWRKASGRGYTPTTQACERLLCLDALPAHPPGYWAEGVRLMTSPVRLAAQPLLAGIKHLNRLEQVLASRDWPADVAEALLCDHSGHAICGTRSNIFIVLDGQLCTPALDQCGVSGVMRGRLLEIAARQNLTVRVTPLPLASCERAQELLLCNGVLGLWPVRYWDDRAWQVPGPITRLLTRYLGWPAWPT